MKRQTPKTYSLGMTVGATPYFNDYWACVIWEYPPSQPFGLVVGKDSGEAQDRGAAYLLAALNAYKEPMPEPPTQETLL